MERVIGCAVLLGSLETIVELEELAGVHVARIDAGRTMPDGLDLLADADRAQRLHRLRAGVDGGADLAEHGRLLEHLSLDPDSSKRVRGRKAREAAADNRDPATQRHSFLQTCRELSRPGTKHNRTRHAAAQTP